MNRRARDDGTARSEVASTTAAFLAAVRAGDAGAAAAAYTDDAQLLAPGTKPLTGRTEIEAFWRAGIDSGVTEVRLHVSSTSCSRELAYEIGRYEMRLRAEDGAVVRESGHYLLVHSRQPDGSWRREAEMLGPDRSAHV